MSIDFESETIITIGEGCRAFPPNGISDATMARWIQKGVKGVKLETLLIGGRRVTSREAICRFIARQNPDESPAIITKTQRRRQSEAARQALQEAGI